MMFHDDDLHEPDCQCFACAIIQEAEKRQAAGELSDWEIPSSLIDVLAQQIATRVDPATCLKAIDVYGSSLRVAVSKYHPQLGAEVIQLNASAPAGQAGQLSPAPIVPNAAGEPARIHALPFLRVIPAAPQDPTQHLHPDQQLNLVVTAELSLQLLTNAAPDTLRSLWWSCQAWLDHAPPAALCANLLHSRRRDNAQLNQRRIEGELSLRRQAAPAPPPAHYLAFLRQAAPSE
jgi:hypothetical protein